MNHKILFVDDEENILKAIKRLLHKSGYELFFAQSGQEALTLMGNGHFSVIVTDMRMPEMNGVELVRRANELDPASLKIILSGYSDIDDIMSAVNGGHIHSYITKPWKEADLMITLMNACEMYERKVTEKRLLEEVKIKNLELKELNENLEKIIQSRTWQINASNALLNSILRGAEEEEVLLQGARVVSQLSGKKPVLFISELTGAGYRYPENEEDAVFQEDMIDKVRAGGKTMFSRGAFYHPLTKRGKILGILVLFQVQKEDTALLGRINPFLSEILLYLSQEDIIRSVPEMMGSIDSLINVIDEAEKGGAGD